GVRMTHARAVEWARCNVIPRRDGRAAAMVTWFPFHHIAGLGTLFEVAEPAEQHFLPMKQFLGDPSKWLRLVSQTRASYAVSPSSVWAEALRGVSENPGGIDLSCLERAVFNAEMVDPEVLERLQEVCLPLGLPSGAIAVHYASSEAGMISHTEPTGEVRVDRVDLEVLATSGKAVPARREGPVKEVVSCGVPYPGTEICIGGPSRPLPERELGEIWARGPGVADGYVNVEDEGRFLDGWLRVGDLGYMAEGELFVTGRADEVVVHFGHKYNPEDIEQSVRHATGLGPGSCLAFSPVGGRPGELVVLVENDKQDRDLAGFIIQAVARGIGIAPTDVVFVPRGTMPATANGKLQRSRARAMYAKGELPPG
ncbi:MAG TPA: AMP-binding protein, partial [Acidimicrobiales bacterium]|nr:AMP-binding protein [Acidimicrobiales bacterium]